MQISTNYKPLSLSHSFYLYLYLSLFVSLSSLPYGNHLLSSLNNRLFAIINLSTKPTKILCILSGIFHRFACALSASLSLFNSYRLSFSWCGREGAMCNKVCQRLIHSSSSACGKFNLPLLLLLLLQLKL